MKPSTESEMLEFFEKARDAIDNAVLEPNTIGSKENPFVCHISLAREMKKALHSHDMWVSIPLNSGVKVCQLKEIE